MEEDPSSTFLDGEVIGIRFSLATRPEICKASISDSSISHASQLSNPFLGLPLEFGRCESCGTSEAGKCEGHFGYIELPVPIYHPSHISELKRMLGHVCLNCLKMKTNKFPAASNGLTQRLLPTCCGDASASQVSIQEVKTTDGACYLALKVSKSKMRTGFWSFLEKYGYRYESDNIRALLPFEVMEIIKRLPQETKKKLAGKGYFPQDGYVLKYLPVPPNCLSVPEVSDGISVMSSDPSLTVLRKVLRKVEIIKNSRSGDPNFESHQVEANDLQSMVDQYLQVRGTTKPARDIETHYGVNKELNDSSTKAWLEKMRTLFIRKGSGFSSRSVITGESYKKINEVGIPLEVAQRITFEEKVNIHNMNYLQELVDKNMCLTYREGLSTYSLRESSKGHTYLKPGQIVHRRIMDGDIVFINRPPTTHKHSLQALSVYIHDDHTVKINPLICGCLGADFDGDCVHLFYPQSLAAKAEVLELFSLEKQLLSSHSGNLNLQLVTDSLLSLKMLFKTYFFNKAAAHQLAMFLSPPLPQAALLKANSVGSCWTAVQMLQCALPSCFDCTGGQYLASQSEISRFDFNRDVLPSMINEIAASIFFGKGPEEVMRFFDVIQPFLMESLFVEGFSVSLKDFFISGAAIRNIKRSIGKTSPLLYQLRSIYNELVQQQLEKDIQDVKQPIINFILKSRLGDLIDSKSESAIDKVVQQIGFLGLQLSDRGKFYTKTLVEDVASHYHGKYHDEGEYPSAEYGLLKGCFFHGLDPYEEMVHSISAREVIVRSSRGLSEPGTLFKNLMAILRDVVICYDGTVRNVCSNSIIQFEYGVKAGDKTQHLFSPGEPVGVLAATAMSNPAYKAVLDASPNSNSSWALMKEILLCKVNFRNEPTDRHVILHLNDCGCGRMYCRENAAYMVKNQLSKVSLKDVAVKFTIEYKHQRTGNESSQLGAGLVGHIHLKERILKEMRINMAEVVHRCQETLKPFCRKKKVGYVFKKIELFCSESSAPCISFLLKDGDAIDLDKAVNILADIICPVLLETIIKGDPRISSASIIWVNPDSNMWVQNPCKSPKGELALDVTLEKTAVKQSGDAWRIVLDSCLPVLHLIDTTRSIPYAIKQVQELLGISCAFDQAIQRIAASVKMVAKGVLREHLLLLASSMTCGGNLVGFNTGGYKALAKQLNIQVPFTDATLFTPRKCFERAAEKCHTDSLASIVAACSWGKRVAVGTGTRFDVLWDAKEVKLNEGVDVYNFLNMVRSTTHEEEKIDACLGEDVDDLLAAEYMDWEMSPERTSGLNAVFEDNGDVPNVPSPSGWDADTHDNPTKTKSNDWSAWTKDKAETQDFGSENAQGDSWSSAKWNVKSKDEESTKKKSNDWSAWTRDTAETQAFGSEGAQEDSWSSGKWKAKSKDEDSRKTKSNDWSAWTRDKAETQDHGSEGAQEDSWSSGKWKAKSKDEDFMKTKSDDWLSWKGDKPETEDMGSERAKEDSWSSDKWKGKSKDIADVLPQSVQEDSSRSKGWDAAASWNRKAEDVDGARENSWSSDKLKGRSKDIVDVLPQSVQEDFSRSKGWDAAKTWNRKADEVDGEKENSWSSDKWKGKSKDVADVPLSVQEDSSRSKGWDAAASWNRKTDDVDGSGWKNDGHSLLGPEAGKSNWNKVIEKKEIQSTSGWGSSTFGDLTADEMPSQTQDNRSWGKPKSQEDRVWGGNSDRVGKLIQKKEKSTSGWGAKFGESSADEQPHQTEELAKSPVNSSSWGGKPKSSENQVWGETTGWDGKVNQKNKSISGWGSSKLGDNLASDEHASQTWDHAKSPVNNSSWGKPKSSENQVWNSQNESSSQGWDSQNATANSDGDRDQWGKQSRELFKKNRSEGSAWGSNAGERKNKNRPPRTPGTANNDTNIGGLYTVTRQRLDIFTSEEQDILKDVEPIMQSIRRIMQSGYNDGDPLAAEDQTFVLENVLEHHPDKEAKMGAGIDHVMISRHSSFQDTRCFYVVSKDGQKQDFSYRKCLENLMKKKYPETAEEFIGKYFRKPGPRPGVRREQTSTPTND